MRKVTLALLLLVVVAVVGPLAAQDMMEAPTSHAKCEVDLTGKTVTFYHFGDISKRYAPITKPLVAAFSDALKYYNAHGGLCGATIASYNEDTENDLDKTRAIYESFKGRFKDMYLLTLYSSPDSELLRAQVEQDQIPVLISAGSVPGLYGEKGDAPGWIFATNPLYVDQLGSFCTYVGANADKFPDATIGYLSWPDAFGTAAFTPEAIKYCASKNVTVIDTPEIFLPTDTDISTQVQNLVDKGATIIYTNTLATGPVIIGETLRTLGLEGEIQLAGVNWVMDTSAGILSARKAPKDQLPALNGMLGSMPFRWWTEVTDPGIKFVTQEFTANKNPGGNRNIAYLLTWGQFDLTMEIYIQTLNRVGSLEALSGAEMKKTLENLDFSPLGLFTVKYEGGKLRSTNENRIVQMAYLNKAGNGRAASREDATTFPDKDSATGESMLPIVIPLMDFAPAPDLRPGGADVPK